VTLNDLENDFCCLKPFQVLNLENMAYINYGMYTHKSKAHVACNCNCLFETDGFLKVKYGQVNCKLW